MTSGVLGIEVAPKQLRALRRMRRGARAIEVDWNPEAPDDAMAALRGEFGTGARIAVAFDTSALFIKRLPLPSLPETERRRVIALDPERYFPVREESLVIGVGADDLVMAARAEPFDRVMDALATLGTVERVEPTPAALVRHLAAAGIRDAFIVMANLGDRDCAAVAMRGGRLAAIRKLPNDAAEIAAAAGTMSDPAGPCFLYPWLDRWVEPLADGLAQHGLSLKPVPPPRGTAENFAAACGAVSGVDGPDALTLTSPALDGRQRVQGWRRAVVAVGALVLAVIAALWSVSARRTRTLAEVERRVAAEQERASDLQRIQADIGAARAEVARLATAVRERPDPLDGLLFIAQKLPAGAQLTTLHAAGDTWELDGYAPDAASLIPTFAASDTTTDVHFRAATARVQVGNRTYENFSLALRFSRPAQ